MDWAADWVIQYKQHKPSSKINLLIQIASIHCFQSTHRNHSSLSRGVFLSCNRYAWLTKVFVGSLKRLCQRNNGDNRRSVDSCKNFLCCYQFMVERNMANLLTQYFLFSILSSSPSHWESIYSKLLRISKEVVRKHPLLTLRILVLYPWPNI